jgi:hypothetical protein
LPSEEKQQDVLVDTCCLINMSAATDLRHLLPGSGLRWHVPAAVAGEAAYLPVPQEGEDDEGEGGRVEVAVYLDAGVVILSEVQSPEESERFVELASQVADGEAMTLAMAKERRWTAATDDRKARRLAAGLDVDVITTPEIMRLLVEAGCISGSDVSQALRNIERICRFAPTPDFPQYNWWVRHL